MATKISDLTVAAGTGAWSLPNQTMSAGAKTVTIRRKPDGAVLATRSFTVQAADSTAPAVTFTSISAFTGSNPTVSASATDAVGVVAWLLDEKASDSGWSNPASNDSRWVAVTATTSWSASSLAYTSTASGTGTRYFRLYCKDAAGNVAGGSTTRSATVTMPAAPSYVASGTYGTTPGIPAGTASGDVLILASDGNIGAPSGWTAITSTLFWLARGGSAPSAPSLGSVQGRIAAFRGVNNTTPFDASASVGGGATNGGVTTAGPNRMLVLQCFGTLGGDMDSSLYASVAAGSASSPCGARAFLDSRTVNTYDAVYVMLDYGTQSAAGASGSFPDRVVANSNYFDASAAYSTVLALKPG